METTNGFTIQPQSLDYWRFEAARIEREYSVDLSRTTDPEEVRRIEARYHTAIGFAESQIAMLSGVPFVGCEAVAA